MRRLSRARTASDSSPRPARDGRVTGATPETGAKHSRAAAWVVLFTLVAFLALGLIVVATRGVSNGRIAIGQAVVAGVPAGQAAPAADLFPAFVPQGGVFAVRLHSSLVAAASVGFRDQDYPMVYNGSAWEALIGAGQRVGSEQMISPGTYPVLVRYQLGSSRDVLSSQLSVSVTPTDFPVDAIVFTPEQVVLITPELAASEAAQLSQAYSGFTPQELWTSPIQMPVNGTITTDFGARRSYQGGPITGSHSGVDIGVQLGTPVGASSSGRVAWTGALPDRGNGVIVDHGLGVFTGYFHLSRILADIGQAVSAGDTVGLAGSTGLSTGPHVHWEVVVNGVNIDGMQVQQTGLPWP